MKDNIVGDDKDKNRLCQEDLNTISFRIWVWEEKKGASCIALPENLIETWPEYWERQLNNMNGYLDKTSMLKQ